MSRNPPSRVPRGPAGAGLEGVRPLTSADPRSRVALLIGISDYASDLMPSLRYAHQDARDLRKLLIDPDVGGFPRDSVRTLTNAKATQAHIFHYLSDWLPRVSRGAEVVFLYFAGHGIVCESGRKEEGFLLPHDVDPRQLPTGGIAMSGVARCVQELEARGVVVCLDCCHAGKALTRNGVPESSLVRDMRLPPTVLQGITGQGRFLIASCDEGQQSLEPEELQHGLFTYHLLKGIEGEAARDARARVTVAQLFSYVSKAVSADARDKYRWEQKPWTSGVWNADVYVTHPLRGGPASWNRRLRTEGPEAAIRQVERETHAADEKRLLSALAFLRNLAHPAGVPVIFRSLGHPSPAVRERAKQAFEAVGRDETVEAINGLARGGDDERMAAVLEGLAAFEAHPDTVALLNRLVDVLRGELRVQALLLLDRKRLSLERETVAEFFRSAKVDYQIEKVLHAGPYTADYLARHRVADNLQVVVRVLREDWARHPEVRIEFRQRACAAVGFIHQNLLPTRTVGEHPDLGIYYTVHDYRDHVTLQKVLAKGRRFEPLQAVGILRQAAQALTPIHEQGGAHAGVNPTSILLASGDQVYLEAPSLPPSVAGLPSQRLSYEYRYLPPEQFGSEGEPRSDFYALGCVAYQLFCGHPPFDAEDCNKLIVSHSRDPVPPLRERLPKAGEAVDHFLGRLLAKDVNQRPADLAEFFTALSALEEALTARDRPAGDEPGLPPEAPQGPAPDLLLDASLARYGGGQSLVRFDRTDPNRPGVPPTLLPDPGEGLPSLVTSQIPPEPAPPPVSPTPEPPASSLPPPAVDPPPLPVPDPIPPVPDPPEGTLDPEPPSPRPDNILPEGSIPLNRLGAGQYGEVLRAQAPGGFEVAVKRIFRSTREESSQREMQALRLLRSIRHPYLLQTQASWVLEDHIVIVMELADGSLEDWFNECQAEGKGGIPLEPLLTYFDQAAQALDFLHEKNVVHRDVKPGNLLRLGGVAKVADFGLARLHHGQMAEASMLAGSPAYMAPEVWRNQIAKQSDQYSLAVTYVRMRTGSLPFPGRNIGEILQMLHAGKPDLSDLPEPEKKVLRRALANAPQKRYPTCKAFTQALVKASAPASAPHHPRPRARGWLVGVAFGVLLGLLLGLLVWLLTTTW